MTQELIDELAYFKEHQTISQAVKAYLAVFHKQYLEHKIRDNTFALKILLLNSLSVLIDSNLLKQEDQIDKLKAIVESIKNYITNKQWNNCQDVMQKVQAWDDPTSKEEAVAWMKQNLRARVQLGIKQIVVNWIVSDQGFKNYIPGCESFINRAEFDFDDNISVSMFCECYRLMEENADATPDVTKFPLFDLTINRRDNTVYFFKFPDWQARQYFEQNPLA